MLKRVAWTTTLVFIIAVLIPSVAKLMGRSYNGKSEFINVNSRTKPGGGTSAPSTW